jgi:hypothetical protein
MVFFSTLSVKAQGFAGETSSENIGKVEKKTFAQMSLLQKVIYIE